MKKHHFFRRVFVITVLPLLLAGESAWGAPASTRCVVAKSSIDAASRIRGLQVKREVPCFIYGKEEVKSYLVNSIKEKIPQSKLYFEETIYKALGFIPTDFDYTNGVIEMYLGQLGGFYDPEKGHYVMAGWLPDAMQPAIAVHELTHALQDQHFNLTSIMDPKIDNSDLLLAHSALVEGDATAVMLDYSRGLLGQPSIATEPDVGAVMMQNVLGASFMQGSASAPFSLQLFLIFPYTSGLRFAHTLLSKGGFAALNAAFKTLPKTTEEILHPEKYPASSAEFRKVTEDELRVSGIAPDAKLLYRDTLGEFFISVLLGSNSREKVRAAEAAAGWGGDLVGVFETGDAGQVVIWKTVWDSEEDARQFVAMYAEALGKGKGRGDYLSASGREVVFRYSRGRSLPDTNAP